MAGQDILAQWERIADQFRAITDASICATVMISPPPATASHAIDAADKVARQQFEIIAARAGRLLLETPAEEWGKVSESRRAEELVNDDAVLRWLFFVETVSNSRTVWIGEFGGLTTAIDNAATESASAALEVIAELEEESAKPQALPQNDDDQKSGYFSPSEWRRQLRKAKMSASQTAWLGFKREAMGENHPTSGAKRVRFPLSKLAEMGVKSPNVATSDQ